MDVLPTSREWRIEAVSDAVRIVVGQGRSKIILARLCPPQISENETWANARLMCAAPLLLKAAENLIKIHKEASTPEEKDRALVFLKEAIAETKHREMRIGR